jgi:hypothetical protein
LAKIEDGASGSILAGVDAASKALRVSPRPLDALGHYRFAGATGILSAIAPNSELVQFRWTDAQAVALLQFVRIRCTQVAAFTAAQELSLELINSTGMTAPGTGGTQWLPTAQSFKKRSTMPQSRANEIRMATTTALGLGTRSLAPTPLLCHFGWAGGAGQTVMDITLDLTSSALEYPFVLHQNEGVAVRLGSTGMGSGGSVRICVELAWAEIAAAAF